MQTRKGQEIEDESMQIIESKLGSHPNNEMDCLLYTSDAADE